MRKFPGASMRVSILAGAAVLVGFSLLAATSVEAKPKKTYNVCTAEQVQSPAGKKCIDKNYEPAELAALNVYDLHCGSNGTMLCCKRHKGTGKAVCTQVQRAISASDRPISTDGVLDPGPKKRAPGVAGPIGGGILEQGPGLGTSGPSATGTPVGGSVAPPAPRPGKIN